MENKKHQFPSVVNMNGINVGKQEPTRFNLPIIGEGGLGKRTFLKSMLKAYAQEVLIKTTEVELESIKINEYGSFDISSETGDIHFHLYISPRYGELAARNTLTVLHISTGTYLLLSY